MSSTPLRAVVCAAQIAPVYMNLVETAGKVIDSIREAGRAGARLIVFPETVLPGYPYWTLIHSPFEARARFAATLY